MCSWGTYAVSTCSEDSLFPLCPSWSRRQEAMFRERQESVLVAQVQKANGLIPAAADEAAVVVDRSDIVISVPVEPAAAAIQSDSDPESGRDSAKDGGGSAGDSARTIAGPEQTLNGTHDTGEPNGESRGYSGIYSAPASSAEAKAGRPEPL